MAVSAPSAEEIKKLKQAFPQKAGICLAVMAAIHVFPKSPDDRVIRLLFTVGYFAAALYLLWLIDSPRAAWMKRIYEIKYAQGGPALEQTWRLYLSALNRFCHTASLLLLAFVGASAIQVLSAWFPVFGVAGPIASLCWWGSIIAIVLFPMWGRSYVSDVMQKRRLLAEAVETTDFQPRSMKDIESAASLPERAAVEIGRGLSFLAGGYQWNWSDFFKSCMVFGMPGSGKTVCVLNALLDGLIGSASDPPCSGLLLDPKGDFKGKLQSVCRKHGRERDIVTINSEQPSDSIRWNPLDSDDDEIELSGRFAAALESLGMSAGTGDTFWIDSAKKFIRHAIRLLRVTNPQGEPPSLVQIGELASSLRRLSEVADLVADDNSDADLALAYFADEWAQLADQTRSSIQAFITNMIDPFLMAPYDTLFAGKSTMKIADMIDSGKILHVYMPIAKKPNMSKVICTFVKLEYYQEVLKRTDKERTSFFFCDEFQVYFTPMPGKGDADFFERSRQSRHANIIATQNYPALMKVAGDKESIVNNLLGNCAVKIFLRNTDDKTNEYASKMFGQMLVAMASSNLSQGVGKSLGSSGASASRQYDQKVRAEEFIGLAVPDATSSVKYADTIVHLASRAEVTRESLRWKVHPLKD